MDKLGKQVQNIQQKLDSIPRYARAGQATGLLNSVYPVGSIYMSVVSTSPATLFGGTWAAFGAGRVLVGIDVGGDADFDTVEETGGAKTVAASAQSFAGTASTTIVNHTHDVDIGSVTDTDVSLNSGQYYAGTTSSVVATTGNPKSGGAANYTPAGTNTPGAATSVVQPYITVYMFKRTA